MKQNRKLWFASGLLLVLLVAVTFSTQLATGQGLVEIVIMAENDRVYVGGNVDLKFLEGSGIYRGEVDWGDGSPIDGWVVPTMVGHVYNQPGEYTLTVSAYDANDNLLGSLSGQLTVEEPAVTMAYLSSQVAEAQANGMFTQWQAAGLNRELDKAKDRLEDKSYLLAAFNLDRFAIAGSVITGPDEWVIPPSIAFDMADALRGRVPQPD